MDKKDLLNKIAEFRIEGNLHRTLQEDNSHNSIKTAITDCEDKLKALNLPREAYDLIDKYTSAYNDMSSLYENAAYRLGFADGIEIIINSRNF